MAKVKRAIALSGGGPLVGIHVGAVKALIEKEIDFDVWSCDCIGSWVACVYNSIPPEISPEERKQRLIDFFSFLFVPDDIYDYFPIPTTVFVMDYQEFTKKFMETFFSVFGSSDKMQNVFNPMWYYQLGLYLMSQKWPLSSEEVNALTGIVSGINPLVRMCFNAFWKMPKSGLTMAHVKEMPEIWKKYLDFQRLNTLQKEHKYVYINAYNLTDRQIELFSNNKKYQPLTIEALQAGSSVLFYVENPEINGKKYCEGANIDTLNFKDLLVNHPDLDEIWIVRLADYQFVKPPKTLVEAASLEVMLPFSTIAEDDIKLFKYHLTNEEKMKEIGFTLEQAKKLKIIEILVQQKHIDGDISYEWNQSNYERCKIAGYEAALDALK